MKFNYGDRVVWDTTKGIPVGEGTVCGVATIEQPLLGSNMIVKLDSILSDFYPYDTILVWENWLSLKH